MKNYLQIEVGGKTRGLRFNLGTLEAIKQITGKDPFTVKPESNEFEAVREYTKLIFHAALISDCWQNDEQVDFTDADVTKWVRSISMAQATEILNAFTVSMQAGAGGEASKDTQ